MREPAWRRYLRFWRPNVDADVDDEIRFHFEERVEELVARGLAPAAARARALEEFGDVARVRAELGATGRRILASRRRAERWDAVARDTRYALRRLVRQPGFSVPAALTLALGAGAAAAIYALVHAVLLSPLPYPHADRLVAVRNVAPGLGLADGGLSDGTYLHYRRYNRVFESMGAYFDRVLSITDRGSPERVQAALVTPSVFAVLGARPASGRLCADGDEGADVIKVVIGHELWARRYGGDPGAVGRAIELNRVPRQIVGVMPPDFHFPRQDTQLWFCMPVDSTRADVRDLHQSGIARLRPGVSPERARSDLERLIPGLAGAYRDATPELLRQAQLHAVVVPLRDDLLRDVRPALVLLLGASALVLLITWANAASLFLVRAERLRLEVAVARALGAATRDVARRFLCESLLLAAAGGAAGLALAWLGVETRFGFAPGQIPRLHEVRLGPAVVGFTAALSVVAGLLLGAVSLARAGSGNGAGLASALRSAVGRATGSRRWRRTHRALVAAQLTLALALLVASAAMVQSVRRMQRAPLGFDPAGVVTFELALPTRQYLSYHSGAAFFGEVVRRLRDVPGVRSAEAALDVPLTPAPFVSEPVLAATGAAGAAPPRTPPVATGNLVTPDYFRAMRIPLRRGRTFRSGDLVGDARAVVVSASLARALFGTEDAVGLRLRLAKREREVPRTVVGVVGDVPGETIAGGPARALYFPLLDDLAATPDADAPVPYYPREMVVVVRTSLPAGEVAGAARRIVDALDPRVPVARVRTLEAVVAAATARARLTALLLLVAGGAALLLGTVGVYGVVSYAVSQRTPEFGVRLALGATPGDVGLLVVRQGAAVAAAGVAAGLVVAASVMRVLRGLLFQVSPTDPATFAAMATLLFVVALVASYIPARRAAGIDPARALRAE